jgi:hypothetical protein
MSLTTLFIMVGVLCVALLAFAAGFFVARRLARARSAAPRELDARTELEKTPKDSPRFVRFDALASRGTRSTALADHTEAWRTAMREVGSKLRDREVTAVVFAHGSFVGTDPLSARSAIVQNLPAGRVLAEALGRRTRAAIDRLLGDLGNFGPAYVRLFEEAIGVAIPCTEFEWSSENHHVGRFEGALGLVRVLATHAELVPRSSPRGRILVVGHSHAGQLFALVTRLLAGSLSNDAIRDVARARAIDVSMLDHDLRTISRCGLDFVTFGAPSRYAWADVPDVRSLHVVHGREAPRTPRHRLSGDDWVRRLGVVGSDFPALAADERRLNTALDDTLGAGFAPMELARSLADDASVAPHGELVLVDYGEERLASLLSSGFGHGVYTRLDGMLFHASLVASRLYA